MCGGAAPNLFIPTMRAALCAASKLRSSYLQNTPFFGDNISLTFVSVVQ